MGRGVLAWIVHAPYAKLVCFDLGNAAISMLHVCLTGDLTLYGIASVGQTLLQLVAIHVLAA